MCTEPLVSSSGHAGDTSPVGSVDKALVVLTLLAEAGPDGAALATITQQTGYNKGTVHRLLQALIYRDFAFKSPQDHQYHLGYAATSLARHRSSDTSSVALLRPVLASICSEVQELVHLGALEGTEVLYLEKVEPDRTIRVRSRVGSRAPAARTALGRALLTAEGVPDASLSIYVDTRSKGINTPFLKDQAENLPTVSLSDLSREMVCTSKRGYAEEVEVNERGVCCVAIPIYRIGGPPLAISVSAPASRMPATRRREIAQAMLANLNGRLPSGFSLHPLRT